MATTHDNTIIAVVGGTIIDGNGGPPIKDGWALIVNERIVAVGQRSAEVPLQATTIDATGKFVMPGMLDANVHLLAFTTAPAELIRYEGRSEDLIAEAAQVTLRSGLTTVFDTWGPRGALTQVRDRINHGDLPGSRIFFAGNIVGFGGPTTPDFFSVSRTILSKSEADAIDLRWEQGVGPDLLWMTPDQVRLRVREYIQEGSQDFIKYAGSGHGGSQMRFISFSAEAQRAIVEEAHRAGMTAQAHTTSPESLRLEIQAGADILQHADLTGPVPMPEETLAQIVARTIPCAPLFAKRRFLSWSNQHEAEPGRTYMRVKDENDRRMIAAGAPLLLTTDSFVLPSNAAEHPLHGPYISPDDYPMAMGEAHFRWLEAAAELGMKPMDALTAATRNTARAYKVDKDLGTLEKGKLADLLILDKDPLQDAANYRSISVIIKEGMIIDRTALPTTGLLTTQVVPLRSEA